MAIQRLILEFVSKTRTTATASADVATALALPSQVPGELAIGGSLSLAHISSYFGRRPKSGVLRGSSRCLRGAVNGAPARVWGVYHTPVESLEEAKRLVPPIDSSDLAPGAAREAVLRPSL